MGTNNLEEMFGLSRDGGGRFFKNVGTHLPDYKASHRGRQSGCYVSVLSKMERKLALRPIPKYTISFFFSLIQTVVPIELPRAKPKTTLDCHDIKTTYCGEQGKLISCGCR